MLFLELVCHVACHILMSSGAEKSSNLQTWLPGTKNVDLTVLAMEEKKKRGKWARQGRRNVCWRAGEQL